MDPQEEKLLQNDYKERQEQRLLWWQLKYQSNEYRRQEDQKFQKWQETLKTDFPGLKAFTAQRAWEEVHLPELQRRNKELHELFVKKGLIL